MPVINGKKKKINKNRRKCSGSSGKRYGTEAKLNKVCIISLQFQQQKILPILCAFAKHNNSESNDNCDIKLEPNRIQGIVKVWSYYNDKKRYGWMDDMNSSHDDFEYES